MADVPDRSKNDPGLVPRDRLLQSWKEIAAHLGVSVRTAQKWEELCGLPIIREGVGSKSRIVAYADELDRWRETRRRRGPECPEANSATLEEADLPASTPHVNRRYPGRISHLYESPRLLAYLIPVVAVLGVLCWFAVSSVVGTGLPATWSMEGPVLQFFDAQGRFCWSIDFPRFGDLGLEYTVGRAPIRNGPVWQMDRTLIEDLDGDGRPEVLVCARETRRKQEILMCLGSDGELRWRYAPGKLVEWRGRRFAEYVLTWGIGPFSVGGRRYLLVCARDYTWFPCQLTMVDVLTGQVVQEYWHPGSLCSPTVLDVDKDGKLEVVMVGINNPDPGPGHSALVVLDVPFREPQPGVPDLFGNPGGRESAYLVFPRVDTADIKGEWNSPAIEKVTDTGRIVVLIHPHTINDGSLWARWELDFSFQVVDFTIFDSFREHHLALERQGNLDHPLTQEEIDSWRVLKPFKTAPDGNSPAVNALW